MREKVVALEQAFALAGAALAQRQEPDEPPPGGAILRISENVRRAVGEHEPRAGGEGQAGVLGSLMGTHHAGDRIAVGNAEPRKAKLLGAGDQFLAVGSPAQEREIGADGQFRIGGHRQALSYYVIRVM